MLKPNLIDSILHHKVVAIDCETAKNYLHDKKSALVYWKGYIRVLTFTTEDGDYFIDLGYNQQNLWEHRETLFKLYEILQNPKVKKVFHNSLFDLCFLAYQFKRMGLPFPKYQSIRDTMLCSQWYWAGCTPHFTKHSLGELCIRLGIDEPVDKTDQKCDWGCFLLDEEQKWYAMADTRITFKCYQKFVEIAQETAEYASLFSVICDTIPAFASMMLHGVPVDYDQMMLSYEQHYGRYLEALAIWHSKFPGESPTIDPKKLVILIKKTYGVLLENASEDSLEPLAKEHPEIQALLDCRLLSKSIKLYEQWDNCYREGSAYASYKIAADSASGRSSSTKVGGSTGFNAQNVIKPYSKKSRFYGMVTARDCVKPSKGKKLVISDYSAAHARIATSLSGDEFLTRSYLEGLDSHCLTAANLCLTLEAPDNFRQGDFMARYKTIRQAYVDGNPDAKRLRDYSKTCFYASLNITGKARLASAIGISEDDAKKVLDAFWKTYKGLDTYIKGLNRKLVPLGQGNDVEVDGVFYKKLRMPTGCFRYFEIRDGKYGRQCYLPDMASGNWLTCEGISLSISIARLHSYFTNIKPEWQARIVCVVHDEIVCEVAEEYALEAEETIYTIMTNAMELWVKGFPAGEKYKPGSMIADCWSEK